MGGTISVTCTPHCKYDVEKPWVTKEVVGYHPEYIQSYHYWFNPNKRETVQQVAVNIETWVQGLGDPGPGSSMIVQFGYL